MTLRHSFTSYLQIHSRLFEVLNYCKSMLLLVCHAIFTRSDYVTFVSLLSQIRLSSVSFVRPTPEVETFGNISLPFCTLAILRPCAKCYGIVPKEPLRRGRYTQEGYQNIAMSRSSISSPDEFFVCIPKWYNVSNTFPRRRSIGSPGV